MNTKTKDVTSTSLLNIASKWIFFFLQVYLSYLKMQLFQLILNGYF